MSKISDAMLVARLLRPYYARAISALTPVACDFVERVAVDKYWRLYYNEKWVEETDVQEVGLIIGAHEVEHLIRDHCGRQQVIDAIPQIFNVAGDCEINDDLPKGSLKDGVFPKNIGCKDGLMAEEYYDHIMSQAKFVAPKITCDGGSGAGNPLEGELPADGAATAVGDTAANQIRDQVASDIREHERNNPGTVPAGVVVWANERAIVPKTDWRRVFSRMLGIKCGEIVRGRQDYSWSRPSRRGMSLGLLLPGPIAYKPRIGLLVDTSGSMGSYGRVVLGHVEAITRSFGTVPTLSCDVDVHRVRGKQLKGGGGTDMRVGIAAAEKCKIDVLVLVTDNETPWPEKPPRFPVIIVQCGDTEAPPWASVVKAEA